MRFVFAGWAGQGVRFMGKVAAKALFLEGYRVRASFEYTAAVRYGPVVSYVLASDREINEIIPSRADALVLLSPRAEGRVKRYMNARFVIKNGVFYEGSPRPEAGLPANMFFLGYLSGILGEPKIDALVEVVGGGKNADALRRGFLAAGGDEEDQ